MRLGLVVLSLAATGLTLAGCGDADGTELGEPSAARTTSASVAGTGAGNGELPEGWPESLVVGFVPDADQEDLLDDIQPFVEVLERELGIPVEGVVTTDRTTLVATMAAGQADLGAFGPFGYVLGRDQLGNIEALVQSIRSGSTSHHGQWFTDDPSLCTDDPQPATALENRGGEIVVVPALEATALQVGVELTDRGKRLGATTLDGTEIAPGTSCTGDLDRLAGRTVAFTTEGSLSGHLFAAAQLVEIGIDPVDDIEAVFAGDDEAALTTVRDGDADVGVSFDDARSTIADKWPDVGEELIVFSITAEIPHDVLAVRSELPPSLKGAVYEAIASYVDTDEGRAVFDEIYGWSDIRPADEADFDAVRQTAEVLEITEPPE